MNYTSEHINFELLSSTEFERLCFEFLIKLNYSEVTWRQGGADNGRDIEANLNFNSPLLDKKTKWFFECKHYTSGGVPPEHLNSKIAWADAEKPDFLVIFVSSYITTGARTWLDKITIQKSYSIIIIEGENIKKRLLNFPDLIERFFSLDRHEKLFLDIKKHWLHYNIDPSYEALNEIIENISIDRLAINDIGFLLISYYKKYLLLELRDNYYGDIDLKAVEKLFPRLKALSTFDSPPLFEKYKDDFDFLGSSGCFEEAGDETPSETNFQHYTLHLNYSKSKEHWNIGEYLFLITLEGDIFELLALPSSEFKTSARYHGKLTIKTFENLMLEIPKETWEYLIKYNSRFKIDNVNNV